MHFLILLVVQAVMPGAIAEDPFFRYAYEKFNDLETKIVQLEKASETKISGLKSEMTQMEEASEIKIRGLKSEIAQMKEASETKISGLKSEMTQTEEASETKISGLESEITQMKASETKINKLESKIAQMEKGIRCQSGRVRFGNMGKDNGQGNWMKKEISLTGFKSQPTSFSYALSEFFADFTEERKGSGVVLTGWTHNSTLAFIWARGYKGKPVYHMHATWMACSH